VFFRVKSIRFYLFIVFLLSFFIFNLNKTYADSDISITSIGPAFNTGNYLIQSVSVDMKAKKNWQLLVVPLSSSLKNISNPSKQIPVSRLEIQDSSGSYNLELNKPAIIASGNGNNVGRDIIKEFTLKLGCNNVAYPGIYTGILQFMLISGHTSADIFNLSLSQPEIQDISISPDTMNISVSPDNSMHGYSQESKTFSRIYIRSNKRWKLILQGQSAANSFIYAFKVVSSQRGSKIYYNSEYTDISNTPVIIAEGEPTVSQDGTSLVSEIIEINYMLKTDNPKALSAGSYPLNTGYYLKTS